ncbi:phosphatase [Kaistia sp. 32K]|uniref:HAD family hydrolase n=1 Tax=Kaistia sp. 32K TaxID=2795690 RepID=UPI0019157A91|nr:HAD hydrolase-like protein [Kaistia sp. 32K]BCP56344.1 phosphatase [Kaistia sp. 32K]
MTHYTHAIWDWNGTLLDDFEITARITIDAMADLGVPGITPEQVRHEYRRPLKAYFSSLLGREADAAALAHLGGRYDILYGERMHAQPLATDAIDALNAIGQAATQSLLSMAPHAQIDALIDHHDLRGHFVLVQGFAGTGHPTKHESLLSHCAALDLPVEGCCLIGDTVDDFEAAAAAGMGAILVATGMQSRAKLEATGAPVTGTLREAASLFLGRPL